MDSSTRVKVASLALKRKALFWHLEIGISLNPIDTLNLLPDNTLLDFALVCDIDMGHMRVAQYDVLNYTPKLWQCILLLNKVLSICTLKESMQDLLYQRTTQSECINKKKLYCYSPSTLNYIIQNIYEENYNTN